MKSHSQITPLSSLSSMYIQQTQAHEYTSNWRSTLPVQLRNNNAQINPPEKREQFDVCSAQKTYNIQQACCDLLEAHLLIVIFSCLVCTFRYACFKLKVFAFAFNYHETRTHTWRIELLGRCLHIDDIAPARPPVHSGRSLRSWVGREPQAASDAH
jgi:hypothetical protein